MFLEDLPTNYDSYDIEVEIVNEETREQQKEDRKDILTSLVCVTSTLAIVIIVIGAISTDRFF